VKANQQISKSPIFAYSANLILESKLCQQFYPESKFICRHQQHDCSAGTSRSSLARQSTEMISFPPGAFLSMLMTQNLLLDLPATSGKRVWEHSGLSFSDFHPFE
jgi:hypothetical protein